MDPARWQRIETVFGQVEALPVDERESTLARLCRGDDDLRGEVESLLAAADNAGTRFDDLARRIGTPGRNEPAAPPAGTRFGAWRTIREIGRGGMGVVYLAERDDAEFDKRVALKCVQANAEDTETARLFRREREIIARLEHPNIARLLDGGTLEDGTMYAALEFVDGHPADRYCEETGAGLEERLSLVEALAEAVDDAHRHLVVHGDIKPANVLVTAGGPARATAGHGRRRIRARRAAVSSRHRARPAGH